MRKWLGKVTQLIMSLETYVPVYERAGSRECIVCCVFIKESIWAWPGREANVINAPFDVRDDN